MTTKSSFELKEQTKFEKLLFRKTVKAANEIIMLDGLTILYRSSVDIYCYVMGSSYENELILLSALDCLFSSLNGILRKEFEKKVLLGKSKYLKPQLSSKVFNFNPNSDACALLMTQNHCEKTKMVK